MLNGTKRLPEGVQDIHSIDLEIKENVIAKLKKLYRSYGYRQVQTPIFEYYDLFLEINGTIDREKMVKLVDRDGKILVLRPDATIPIARMVATINKKEDTYYKLSYSTNVFRMNDDKQSITNRELTQAGIELFGKQHSEADVEVITLAIQSLLKLGLKDFKIDLGQANYFKELILDSQISQEHQNEIRKRIEQKNVSELKQILDSTNLANDYKKVLLSIPLLYGSPEVVIRKAEELALNEKMRKELRHLQDVYQKLVKSGYEDYLSIDLGMINDLNYYTGIIFQGYIKDHGKPIVIGGRYDQLTKQFGSDLPATGFGFYLDDVLEVMKAKEPDENTLIEPHEFILFTEENREDGLLLANKLRDKDFIVETEVYQNFMDINKLNDRLTNSSMERITILQDNLFEVITKNLERQTFYNIDDVIKRLYEMPY